MRTKERGAVVKRPPMSPIPRRLFLLYCLISAATFGVSYFFPAARLASPAPLQSVALPAPEPVVVNVLYSTEKEGWLREALPLFEATRPLINGRPVKVALQAAGSREIYLDTARAVADFAARRDRGGVLKPDVVSPASALYIGLLEEDTRKATGAPVVRLNNAEQCRVIVRTPLVVVGAGERADALLRGLPSDQVWTRVYDAVVKPDQGALRVSHTDPTTSASGLLTLFSLAHTYATTQAGRAPDKPLTADDIADPGFQGWLKAFESRLAVADYNTRLALDKLVGGASDGYDVVTTYEATAIERMMADRALAGRLRVVYPPRTLWSEHPFCVLNAPWVSGEKAQAGQMFLDFLLTPAALEPALNRYGFRPAVSSPPLDGRDSPFTRLTDSGLKITLPPDQRLPAASAVQPLSQWWTDEIGALKR